MSEQHEAGRDLNRLVAERVFGYETDMVQTGPILGNIINAELHYRRAEGPWRLLPRFSTDIAAAMLVVEKIGGDVEMMRNQYAESGCDWGVRFGRVAAYAPTLPLAICVAALAAVEESDG